MGLRGVLRTISTTEGPELGFWCPGCESVHALWVKPSKKSWTFNGNFLLPTFRPSVLVTSGHYLTAWQAEKKKNPQKTCWCDFNKTLTPEEVDFVCVRCHSWVTDGMIQFLPDSTHQLSGQTVKLVPFGGESDAGRGY